jgi:5-formyltetrahydrofolate cyclo-ligase
VNKSEIRKKILKIRKQKSSQNLNINYEDILKILKKNKIKDKLVGGYYPYNHEVDAMKILKKLEKKRISNFITQNKKKFSNELF